MKYTSIIIFFIFLTASLPALGKDYSISKSVTFRENKGQLTDQNQQLRNDILFYGNINGMGYFFKNNGFSYQFYKTFSSEKKSDNKVLDKPTQQIDSVQIYRIDASWVGTNKNVKIIKQNTQAGTENYYTSTIPALGVKSFGSLLYKNLYNNIDLKYYSKNGALKYDYIVKLGADYKNIQIKFEGAKSIILNDDGSITLQTPFGNITDAAPEATQEGKSIKAKWVVKNNNLSFEIGAYNKSKTLIIDPLLREWGTYFGGESSDIATGLSTSNNGDVAICGTTFSTTNIATTGVQQVTMSGYYDAYLAKFNTNGNLIWATYYGGGQEDYPAECKFDNSGNIYLAGETYSHTNITTPSSYQPSFTNGLPCFLAKFDTSGLRIWGTYYGGSDNNYINDCTIDINNNIYICGYSNSTSNIATANTFQTTYGGGANDGFIAKFNPSGGILWATYFGGNSEDRLTSCATDSNGNVYAAGWCYYGTTVLSTTGAFQTSFGGTNTVNENGLIIKLDSTGVRQWSTYYGNGNVQAYTCSINNGGLYIGGRINSNSLTIATSGAHQPLSGGDWDGFLSKFDLNGSRIWSTYYGGMHADAVNNCSSKGDKVYICGTTFSPDNIATPGALNTICGCTSISNNNISKPFLAEFDTLGHRLFGTYYGVSSGAYNGGGVKNKVDINNDVYLFGNTGDTINIATSGAYMMSIGTFTGSFGNTTNHQRPFLVKFNTCTPPSVTLSPSSTTTLCYGGTILLSVTSVPNCTYQWYKNDSLITGATGTTYTASQTAKYQVAVTNSTGCAGFASINVFVSNFGVPSTTITKNNIHCYGDSTGSISITPNGGLPPYSYAWNNLTSTSNTVSNLPAGVYIVTTTDSNNCSKNDTITLTQLSPITINKTVTNVLCNGMNNGAATVNSISGGQGPYTKLWSTGATNSSISNLTAGVYAIQVTGAYNCIKSDTFNITEPPALTTSFTTTDNTCFGDSTGIATVTASGGVTPYSYLWTNASSGTFPNSNSITALKAGTYYLQITDSNQCVKNDTIAINEPAQTLVSICAVTVDSATGKNLVIYEKAGIQRAILYNVYRETSVSGQYALIGSLLPNQYSTLLDTSSQPETQSYSYKMSVVDSCNNESPLSDFHKTILLTSNVGINNEVNLIWNMYEGKPYPTNYVMRSVNGGAFVNIAQVASTTLAYTDLTPPAGTKHYRIDIDLPTVCNPSAKPTAFDRISSNTVNVVPNGIDNVTANNIQIVPNPTTGIINVIGTQPAKIKVIDALGRLVISEENKTQLSLGSLASGVYLINLYDINSVNYFHQKIMKQ